jgi:hypothetical protein
MFIEKHSESIILSFFLVKTGTFITELFFFQNRIKMGNNQNTLKDYGHSFMKSIVYFTRTIVNTAYEKRKVFDILNT